MNKKSIAKLNIDPVWHRGRPSGTGRLPCGLFGHCFSFATPQGFAQQRHTTAHIIITIELPAHLIHKADSIIECLTCE